MTDDDLRAMFAYLRSLPAVHNPVPTPSVPAEVVDGFGRLYEKMLSLAPHAGAPAE